MKTIRVLMVKLLHMINTLRMREGSKYLLFLIGCLTVVNLKAEDFSYNEFEGDASMQQEISITGKVTSLIDGSPIIGVNIVVKGTTNGTVTDIDGDYRIKVPSKETVLVFSFIGYLTEEIVVGDQKVIDLSLVTDIASFEEIVVVGYGSQKRTHTTGAVTMVDEEVFKGKGAVSNPLQALQGALAGVTVTRSSGAPGREEYSFEIRGATSINGTAPLVLIDGVPGDLSNINPDDIENISVLKDASSAIYGARAAGGVVLITTKRGTDGKIKVSYKSSIDFKKPGLMMQQMNMQHYMMSYQEAILNEGGIGPMDDLNIYPIEVVNAMKTNDPEYMNSYINYKLNDIEDYTFFDTDWNDAMYGTGIAQSHNISLAGGNEKNRYLLSAGYFSDNGMLKYGDDNAKRYNIRLNYDVNISKRVKLETSTSFERKDFSRPSLGYNITVSYPGMPLANQLGQPYTWGNTGHYTPNTLAEHGGSHTENRNSFRSITKLTVSPIDGLNIIGNAAFNPQNHWYKTWENAIDMYNYEGTIEMLTYPSNSKIKRWSRSIMYQLYNAYAEYSKSFAGHDLKIMAGTSYEKNSADEYDVQATGLINQDIHTLETWNGDLKPAVHDKLKEWAIASYFGRLNYTIQDKYLIEGNYRIDGSSRFAPGYRWKSFYGGSIGWRLSREDFIQSLNFFDGLKIRASYGTAGNQSGIREYDYSALQKINNPSGNANTDFGLFGADPTGAYLGQLITQENETSLTRSWEVVESSNIGLDFGILNNRLQGTFDYFIKHNKGMLIPVVYPAVYGAEAPFTNSGELMTKGWEFTLLWKHTVNGFSYNIGFNLGDNKNEVTKWEGSNAKLPGLYDPSNIKSSDPAKRQRIVVEGYPLYSYFGYERDGLISDEQELEEYLQMAGGIIPTNIRVGDVKFKDLVEDGILTDKDIKYLGNANVRFSFGINLGASWKGFDISTYWQGVGKRSVMRDMNERGMFLKHYANQNDALWGRWYSDLADKYGENGSVETVRYEDGPMAGELVYPSSVYDNKGEDLYPKLSLLNTGLTKYNYSFADWLVEDGAYLRLKNLIVGYTIPKKLTDKVNIEKLRVYFAGTDMFEFSRIKDGWDPEASISPDTKDERYPFSRTYSFGLELNF